jgi:hypothetical protein
MILANEGLAEGVYAASGDTASVIKCDSKYMNGIWQHQKGGNSEDGYKSVYGCLGCPAYTETACGLVTHYEASGNAESYNNDNGKRKPAWEWLGYKPDEYVTNWTSCGNQVGADQS